MEDAEIRNLLLRLGRPDKTGNRVIERAALRAEGSDLAAVEAWILGHGGQPEAVAAPVAGRGLHAAREHAARPDAATARYVLPRAALEGDAPEAHQA
jgi:hypothetical protein